MAPGAIVIYIDPKSSGFTELGSWLKSIHEAVPGVRTAMKLEATDTVDEKGRPYRYEYLLQVADIDAVDDGTLEELHAKGKTMLNRSDWNLFRSISFDKKPNFDDSVTPPLNMQLVQVGMAPRNDPDNIADYHDWYKTEHMPFLAEVPGWQVGNRYEYLRSVGDKAEIVRPFLAAHLYDEVNGLGGPEWRKSVDSEYTKRVQRNCVEPNHRRTWKVVG